MRPRIWLNTKKYTFSHSVKYSVYILRSNRHHYKEWGRYICVNKESSLRYFTECKLKIPTQNK